MALSFAIFAGDIYLGTFAYASAQMAKNAGLAIARRRNLGLVTIAVVPVVEVADLVAA
jgi:hypothetical protein